MAEAITSEVALAVKDFAAYVGRLRPAFPSSSSSTPHVDEVGKIGKGVEQLSRMLPRIRASLNDAEDVEIKEESVRRRLQELKGVAYDAEDVLDEFTYEVLRLRSTENIEVCTKDVADVGLQRFIEMLSQKIEAINSRYDEIMKDKFALGLEGIHGRGHVGTPEYCLPTSCYGKSRIFGRDNDLMVLKRLLGDESSGSSNFSVIAIVGMGGLGKTTLAQLAYGDDAVTNHFDVRSWVHVTQSFDVIGLTKAMIESITSEPCQGTQLGNLHNILKQQLKDKRFLLVLDNVWEKENLREEWSALTVPLYDGSMGSKVIITTRSEKVAGMAQAASVYHLPFLKEEDCMELFWHRVFEGRDPGSLGTDDSLRNLMVIGERISKKCQGLPLAVGALASLLHGKDDEAVWNDILQHDIRVIDEEKSIIPILGLSYRHLPASIKRCFRYCSVFPKGYEFDRDRLVQMWMAHDCIRAENMRSPEDVGNRYFDDLLQRSFFQNSQNPEIFLMHDLMQDLASSVSNDECCSVVADKPYCSIPADVRHVSIVGYGDPYSIPSPRKPTTVRSLLFISCLFKLQIPSLNLLDNLLAAMKQLRVLDLSYLGLGDLPSSIGCLKQLRFLGLRCNLIRELPEWIGTLYHLQTLDIGFSLIHSLPGCISDLLNLRHIICEHKLEYPEGIGKLINLQTMADFHVSPRLGCANLGELENINNIRGLGISGIGNLTDVHEAKKACLERKEQLRALDLSLDSRCPSHLDHNEVLEVLKPHRSLRQLRISYFMGGSLPSWLESRFYFNLGSLKLIHCKRCTSFPSLGMLPSLRYLSIQSAKQVGYIGYEFFCGGFQRLETLELKFMDNWTSWSGARRGECRRLRELNIFHCRRLTTLSLVHLDALQDLVIDECDQLNFSTDACLGASQAPRLRHIFVHCEGQKKRITGFFPPGEAQSHVTSWLQLVEVEQLEAQLAIALGKRSNTRQLSVYSCSNLTSLSLGNQSYLQRLEIGNCHILQSVSSGNLNALLCIHIHGCGNLQYFPVGNLNSLELLRVDHCGQLQFSNEDHLPSTLKTFIIDGCPLLTKWCQYHRQRLQHIGWLAIQDLDTHVVLQNVVSVKEAAEAYLADLQRLLTLELMWDSHARHGSFSDEEPEEVLNNLRPHNNLNKLVIRGYIGSRFPAWLGASSYTNLVYVTLIRCSQCEILPPLGQLPVLVELCIREADMLRCPGKEFFKGSSSTGGRRAFPSLRKLEIRDTPSWEEWLGTEDGAEPWLCELTFEHFWTGVEDDYLPSLCELILTHCPMLKTLPRLPPSLTEMEVANCDVITFPHSLDHITSLSTLRISQVPVLKNLPRLPSGLRRLVLDMLPALTELEPPPSLRDLVLQGCSEMMVATSLPRLTLVTSLHVSDSPKLTTIPLHNLGILQELHISNCPELEALDCFSFSPAASEYIEGLQALRSLQRLSISDCPTLQFSANERPPSSLESMDIYNCPLAQPWHGRNWRN